MSEKIQLPESLKGKTAIVAGAAGFLWVVVQISSISIITVCPYLGLGYNIV